MGTKPAMTQPTLDTAHIVVRSFRSQTLVLVQQARAARYYHWSADRTKALRLSHAEALGAADAASREYGAECAVLAADGTVTVTASVRMQKTPADPLPAALVYLRELLQFGFLDSLDDALVDTCGVFELTAADADTLKAAYLK